MEDPRVLKITTLDKGWRDKDQVMLHACFQLLCDCIENENLFTGHVQWDHDEEHITAKKELLALYDWWKQRVERDKKGEIDSIWGEGQYEEDDAMLIRLIQHRKYLWT